MSLAPATRIGPTKSTRRRRDGEVYWTDARLDRIVHVKVLAPDLAADFRARLEQEAKAIFRAHAPAHLRLYEIGPQGRIART